MPTSMLLFNVVFSPIARTRDFFIVHWDSLGNADSGLLQSAVYLFSDGFIQYFGAKINILESAKMHKYELYISCKSCT